jgi:hypothetical protein
MVTEGTGSGEKLVRNGKTEGTGSNKKSIRNGDEKTMAEKTSSNKKSIRNGDEQCWVKMVAPAVSLVDCTGFIHQSSFSNIDTGGILVSEGKIFFTRITFANNTIGSVKRVESDDKGEEYVI